MKVPEHLLRDELVDHAEGINGFCDIPGAICEFDMKNKGKSEE